MVPTSCDYSSSSFFVCSSSSSSFSLVSGPAGHTPKRKEGEVFFPNQRIYLVVAGTGPDQSSARPSGRDKSHSRESARGGQPKEREKSFVDFISVVQPLSWFVELAALHFILHDSIHPRAFLIPLSNLCRIQSTLFNSGFVLHVALRECLSRWRV